MLRMVAFPRGARGRLELRSPASPAVAGEALGLQYLPCSVQRSPERLLVEKRTRLRKKVLAKGTHTIQAVFFTRAKS